MFDVVEHLGLAPPTSLMESLPFLFRWLVTRFAAVFSQSLTYVFAMVIMQ